ncbi:MAG: acetyl-CoA carboxylase [Pseudomonas sp.]|nr:acetyl-CoA carboxylase [Pseudomonas sp.]
MATFEPGHLHIERHALNKDDVSYDLCIDYVVSQDPKDGKEKGMLFTLHGSIQGKELKEDFFLPKDQAYNFASNVTKIAEKYGIPKALSSIGSIHKHYDAMFEDVRVQLDMKSGDPVKPEHLE